MSFLKNLAKGFGEAVINKVQQRNDWKQEADMLDDEKLVRMLNSDLPIQKRNAYAISAKERGTIGLRNGEFYIR